MSNTISNLSDLINWTCALLWREHTCKCYFQLPLSECKMHTCYIWTSLQYMKWREDLMVSCTFSHTCYTWSHWIHTCLLSCLAFNMRLLSCVCYHVFAWCFTCRCLTSFTCASRVIPMCFASHAHTLLIHVWHTSALYLAAGQYCTAPVDVLN